MLTNSSQAAEPTLRAGNRPNIVLIMADDVSWECFSCYGAEDYRTPNIDALAAQGIQFRHCYSTPLCTTSRVQIMTGKYNFRNYTHFGYLNPKEKTFANLLQDCGYKTAVAGKWQLNGLSNALPGYLDNARPYRAGFDEYLLWQLTKPKAIPGGGERYWSPPLEHNGKLVSAQENANKYGPDLMCDFLCDFMERNRSEPFFAYYPMLLVHDPFVPTPNTIDAAPIDSKSDSQESLTKADRSQSANRLAQQPPNGDEDASGNQGSTRQQRNLGQQRKKNFVAMVEYMDKLVGRIMGKLAELDQLDNTIILFTADNGTNRTITSQWNGRAIQGGKGGLTNMGTHVPLIVSWKGKTPAGQIVDDLVDFTDFYPTLADAAGASLTAEDPSDGYSFFPRLVGQTARQRPWVLCHYQPYWNMKPGQFARDAQFKLYREGRLYQIESTTATNQNTILVDLDEQNDLSRQELGPAAAEAVQRLRRVLEHCPPAPTAVGDRNSESRPVYPEWPSLN